MVFAEPTQDVQEAAPKNLRLIVTQETALNFVETLPNGRLKWGEFLEYPHGWGQAVNIGKQTGRVYFSSDFICNEDGKKVVKRVYFDITDAMPLYRDALSPVCSQIVPRLKQLRQLLTSIKDKDSAERLSSDIAPLHAEESLSSLQSEQAQKVIDIYRHTPELSAEYESRSNWIFVPMLYHKITTDCYLLCVEVGSGAIIYLFSLVKKQPDGNWLLLNHTNMSPGEPGHDLRCNLENDRYHIEILCGKEWESVFSGTFSQPTRTYRYINIPK